jgi:predicted nucleic acid-binding protein
MKVFIDTNVILEYTMERERAEIVDKLFDTLQNQGHQKLMSVGGFYTILYVIDKFLKKELLLDKDVRIKMIRSVMQRLL